MAMQEERFSLGENSNHIVTVTPFNTNLKVHIRQFYVNENGEIASRIGVTLSVEVFNELVKPIPKVQESIARYELRDTGISSGPFELVLPVLDLDTVFLPSLQSQEPLPIIQDKELLDTQPKFPSPPPSTSPDVLPPLINLFLENTLIGLNPKEKLEGYHQDLAADEYLYGPTTGEETLVTERDNPVSLPSLENIDDDSQKKRKEERRRSKESAKNVNKKLKTPVSLPSLENIDDGSQKKRKEKRKRSKESAKNVNKKLKTESGIFVGYCEAPPELKVTEKKERKKDKVVKKECIDEVDLVESMKEVERKLWLTHYYMLSDKLMEVVREKCTGCQMNEPSRLGHEFCLMSSSEKQVNLCFGEMYKRVIWDEVLDNWYKKVLEMPISLNPETLAIFR